MIHQGSRGASSHTVTIPDHLPGDMIIISARHADSVVTNKPAAGGTVPAWTDVLSSAVSGEVSLRTAYAIATRSDHTSGVWPHADQLIVAVFRPTAGRTLAIVRATRRQSVVSSPSVIYPALSRDTSATVIASMGYRVAASFVSGDSIDAPPASGWDHQWAEPTDDVGTANSSSVMSSSFKPTLTSNPGNDLVPVFVGPGSNAYCGHTLQVAEVQGDADDIFDEVTPLTLPQIQVLQHKFFGGRPDYQEAMKYVVQEWAFRAFGSDAAPHPAGLGTLPAGEFGGLLHAIQLDIPTIPTGAELAAYVDALHWRSFSPRDWSNLYSEKLAGHLNDQWVGPNEWK